MLESLWPRPRKISRALNSLSTPSHSTPRLPAAAAPHRARVTVLFGAVTDVEIGLGDAGGDEMKRLLAPLVALVALFGIGGTTFAATSINSTTAGESVVPERH